MTRLLILFFVLTITSCDFMMPKPPTEEQQKKTIDNALFDQRIISNLAKYKKLKAFLESNIDTIIKFRHSKNTATLIGGQGKPDSNYLADDNCYNFFQGNARYDISNVPDFLKKQLDTMFHSFGEKGINSFEVCKDKKITIQVRSEGGENGLYISHNLLWNTKIEKDYAYSNNKDTLIDKDCIYRIGMSEHHGH